MVSEPAIPRGPARERELAALGEKGCPIGTAVPEARLAVTSICWAMPSGPAWASVTMVRVSDEPMPSTVGKPLAARLETENDPRYPPR